VLRRAAVPTVLDLEVGSAPWEARIDVGRLEQVMTNLVLNARDAMPAGGTVRLKTAQRRLRHPMGPRYLGVPEGDYVSLEVRDEGVGLSEAVKERLFEPFFTTKGERGSGLGLASVYGIARQAGGRVVVESTLGAGATFEVLLPRAG
jgi:two-component system cell cycle sensor histidine kinase/response regulator CckA